MPRRGSGASSASRSALMRQKKRLPNTWPDGKNPWVRIEAVLSGETELKSEDASIQSMCSFRIYKIACDVLWFATVERRREALTKIPERLRPHVENEVRRLWDYRRSEKNAGNV
jgi:hypothetical protein